MRFINTYEYLEETAAARAEYASILTKLAALAEYRSNVSAGQELSISPGSPNFLGTDAKRGFAAERDIIKKKLAALDIYRSSVPHMSKEELIVSGIYVCSTSAYVSHIGR